MHALRRINHIICVGIRGNTNTIRYTAPVLYRGPLGMPYIYPLFTGGLEYHGEGGFDSEGKNSFRLK